MPSQILPITQRPSELLILEASPPTSVLIKPEIDHDDLNTSLIISSQFDDDNKSVDVKPLLSRASSYSSTSSANGNSYQHRRRRSASDNSLASLSDGSGGGGGSRRRSFSKGVGHAAAETFLITRLSLKLLRYLGYAFSISNFCLLMSLFSFFSFFLFLWTYLLPIWCEMDIV